MDSGAHRSYQFADRYKIQAHLCYLYCGGMAVEFQWDPKKAAANLRKHGVVFDEALTVFADPLAKIFDDEDHSTKEEREIIVGHSVKHRLLVVCFAAQEGSARIFSARKATKQERKDYEENVEP